MPAPNIRTILCAAAWMLTSSALPLAAQALVITTPQSGLPVASVGTTYTTGTPLFSFSAAGGSGGYMWSSTTITQPYGTLSVNSNGQVIGQAQGCPDFWNSNNSPQCSDPFEPMTGTVTVTVTDSASHNTSQQFTISAQWNPTQASYTATQLGYFSQMAVLGGFTLPHPLALGGHLDIANPLFRNSSYDNQPAWNAWIDAMHAAGMTIVNIEVDLECIVFSRTSCLALYAGAIAHAHEHGMTVSINPAYYSNASCGDAGCPPTQTPPASSSGMKSACSAFGISINSLPYGSYGGGVNDWYNCLVTNPITTGGPTVYQYILTNWLQSGDRFVPVHEPTTQAMHWNEGIQTGVGGCLNSGSAGTTVTKCNAVSGSGPMATFNTCPQDWVTNFVSPFFTALATWTGVPGGIQYALTVDYPEMIADSTLTFPNNSYAAAFSAYLTSLSITPTPAVGMDLYAFEPARTSRIASTIALIQANGQPAFVEEFGPEAWTLQGASGQACAIVGLQSCAWNNFNQDFIASLLSFLSGQGVVNASLYGTEILGQCVPLPPDQGQSTTVLATATTAIQNQQYGTALSRIAAILSQWNMNYASAATFYGSKLP